MLLIPFVVFLYGILVVYEMLPLYKQKMWADFWVNFALSVLSLFIVVLLCLGVKIPSPETPIRAIITAIFGK
ncbi:MAG: hypothetical protein N2376_00870 [Clostridia bacterium]|nr:hypothetical protein [Clostridia bacterium]